MKRDWLAGALLIGAALLLAWMLWEFQGCVRDARIGDVMRFGDCK